MILAGDIGGTNARLALFEMQNGRFSQVDSKTFPSHEYSGLHTIVQEYRETSGVQPSAACFGVAGPVSKGRVETTNLPWVIEASRLQDVLNIRDVWLINDLEATAWGIPALDDKDLVCISNTSSGPEGHQCVIAAGTGLGQAGIFWDGRQHHVYATEGGHSEFAARDEMELELFRYLHKLYGHVSNERILSGPGLVNVFHFLRDTGRGTEPKWLTEEMQKGDPAAAISQAAMDGKSPLAEEALAIFISVYGAEAGNLALKTMAKGGVFIAGGIAPKIMHKLTSPLFMKAFTSKGRMQPLMEGIPVKVVVNGGVALLGSARYASVATAA